jgi:endogenous inhibitor of DNA gyrase (YacG/DUF329 family)
MKLKINSCGFGAAVEEEEKLWPFCGRPCRKEKGSRKLQGRPHV